MQWQQQHKGFNRMLVVALKRNFLAEFLSLPRTWDAIFSGTIIIILWKRVDIWASKQPIWFGALSKIWWGLTEFFNFINLHPKFCRSRNSKNVELWPLWYIWKNWTICWYIVECLNAEIQQCITVCESPQTAKFFCPNTVIGDGAFRTNWIFWFLRSSIQISNPPSSSITCLSNITLWSW